MQPQASPYATSTQLPVDTSDGGTSVFVYGILGIMLCQLCTLILSVAELRFCVAG